MQSLLTVSQSSPIDLLGLCLCDLVLFVGFPKSDQSRVSKLSQRTMCGEACTHLEMPDNLFLANKQHCRFAAPSIFKEVGGVGGVFFFFLGDPQHVGTRDVITFGTRTWGDEGMT